jgi:hypothetical protein
MGEKTPDHAQDAAIRDTFPASDPPATTATEGSRAVPPEQLIRPAPEAPDHVTVSQRFPDMERAKLTLEALVRDIPVDRRLAELRPVAQEVELRVAAPLADAARVQKAMERGGGAM